MARNRSAIHKHDSICKLIERMEKESGHTFIEFLSGLLGFLCDWSRLFGFLFCFFPLPLKKLKPNGPNPDRLMVAALAANGLKGRAGSGLTSVLSSGTYDLPERGTIPSCPWKSLNADSKPGPSSKIGLLPPRACKIAQIVKECALP